MPQLSAKRPAPAPAKKRMSPADRDRMHDIAIAILTVSVVALVLYTSNWTRRYADRIVVLEKDQATLIRAALMKAEPPLFTGDTADE